MSTLAQIRTKVRRLTGRPSPQQISDSQIDDYVNTFYIYDMPETLRLFTQETVFEFMTEANVDTYDMAEMTVWTGVSDEPAIDVFINVKPPAYVAGYQSFWSQSREQFFRTYPALAQIEATTEGDGTAGPYAVTFPNTPILQNSVTVGAIDSTDAASNVIDVPTNRTDGTWQLINTNTTVIGSVDYISATATVTFPNTIPSGNTITFTAIPYAAARPQAVLYYNNKFTLRPVPNASYLVTCTAYKRPTVFVDSVDTPELKQWWQYLAYGAAKKIFEDAQDPEGLNIIRPGLKEQESLVLRRTIVERTNQRSSTIYTEMNQYPYNNAPGGF